MAILLILFEIIVWIIQLFFQRNMIDSLMYNHLKNAAFSLIAYITCSFSLCFTFYVIGNLLHKLEYDIVKDLYLDLLGSLYEIETKKYMGKSVSEYLLYFNDLEKIGSYIFNLFFEISNLVKLLITLVIIYLFSLETSIMLLFISVVNFFIAKNIFKQLSNLTKIKLKEEIDYLNSFKDNIEGTREVLLYDCNNWIKKRIRIKFYKFFNIIKKMIAVENKRIICVEMFKWIIVIICIFYNGYRAASGIISIGSLVIIYQLGLSYSQFYYRFYDFIIGLSGDFALIERVKWISKKKYQKKIKEFKVKKKGIYFKNVSFSYPISERNVIDCSCIYIPPQKTTVFYGESGSGKSTIINLLTKNFEPTEGSIYIGNKNIMEISEDELFQSICIVYQEPLILNGTVKDNILLGNKGVSWENIVSVCKKMKIYESIQALPMGFETEIGDKGLTISGGERQRIALVRALLQDKEIIILDEATSALDLETERMVMDQFFALRKEKTNIIIAHREYSLKDADSKYQINKGKVIKS